MSNVKGWVSLVVVGLSIFGWKVLLPRAYVIEKQFAYEVQGEVLSASSDDVTWTNDFADVDVGLIWGPRRRRALCAVEHRARGRGRRRLRGGVGR